MKVLMLFVDMLRPNRFESYNSDIQPNSIDHLLNDLGGTLYTNCFSPGPDTPRSMACFYTGMLPMDNGCDTRVKWPGKFINKDRPNIFEPFIENDYALNFFSNPNEREGGLFPPGIENIGVHNQNYDLKGYLNNINLADNHLVFLAIPDYHWALGDWGYTLKAEQIAIKETTKSLEIVFDELDKDDFDHIFIFSDHGFKFSAEAEAEEEYSFINRDRSNIFMFARQKGDRALAYKDKLCSIQDLKHTVDNLFGLESSFSLLGSNERTHVVIEDHLTMGAPSVNQNIDIWAVVTRDEMYVRTPEYGVLINNNGMPHLGVNPHFDYILMTESQFARYLDEHEKVFEYNRLILAQTSYMNGGARPTEGKIHSLLNKFEIAKDRLRFLYKKGC